MHARNLPPSLIRDIRLVRLPPVARLLFISMQGVADRSGRMEDNHDQLAYDVGLMDFDCDKLLNDLQNAGLVKRYAVGGMRFIQILDWHKFQRPHHTERQSRIPAHDATEANGEQPVSKPEDVAENPSEGEKVDLRTDPRPVEICKLAGEAKMYGRNAQNLKLKNLADQHGGYPPDDYWMHAFSVAHESGNSQFGYAITVAFSEWQKSINKGARKAIKQAATTKSVNQSWAQQAAPASTDRTAAAPPSQQDKEMLELLESVE